MQTLTREVRLYPTKAELAILEARSATCKEVYNAALEQRVWAYRNGTPVNYYDQQKEIPKLRKEIPEVGLLPQKIVITALLRVEEAYKGMFKRAKKRKAGARIKLGRPRMRGPEYNYTVVYPGESVYKVDDHHLFLASSRKKGQKPLVIKTKQKLPDFDYLDAKILKRRGKYYALLSYEQKEAETQPQDGSVLAIDLGAGKLISSINQDNEVWEVQHRKPTQKELRRLDGIRLKRDRKAKGSRRYKHLTCVYGRELQRWQNRQKDFLHKVSTKVMTRPERTVVAGELKPSKMKSPYKGMNRLVHGEWRIARFLEYLAYKATKFGKRLVLINEAYTSKTCHQCGQRQNMPVSVRVYACKTCGMRMDRDLNSAINIRNKYLGRQPHGVGPLKAPSPTFALKGKSKAGRKKKVNIVCSISSSGEIEKSSPLLA